MHNRVFLISRIAAIGVLALIGVVLVTAGAPAACPTGGCAFTKALSTSAQENARGSSNHRYTVLAGYLDFSENWSAPADVGMSKKQASNCAMTCKSVAAYANKAGRTTGAIIVAGPHKTNADNNLHLTIRLYDNGRRVKSCHVYVGKNNRCNGNCNCE